MEIRPIHATDNLELAKVIRDILTEYGVNKPCTVFTDPTTDHLFELFQTKNSPYNVLIQDERILGGCGIFPTKGLPNGCVELVKLYIHKDVRKQGYGKELMLKSIQQAKDLGYKEVYLKTLPELGNAIQLYQDLGFKLLPEALGESGHHACTIWMLLDIN